MAQCNRLQYLFDNMNYNPCRAKANKAEESALLVMNDEMTAQSLSHSNQIETQTDALFHGNTICYSEVESTVKSSV